MSLDYDMTDTESFDLMLDIFNRFCYASLVNIKNQTKYKSLDRLTKDPRVASIWSEEGTGDGLWVGLLPGYNWSGCGVVHEYSVRDLLESMRWVKEGATY